MTTKRLNQRRRNAALGVLLLAIVAGFAVRPIVRCTVVIFSLSASRPPLPCRVYRKLFSYKTQITQVEIPSGKRVVHARLYTPVGLADPPAIILVHGLTFEGMEQGGVNFWAQYLAEGGFRVIIPQIESERELMMEVSGVDDVGTTAVWAATHFHRKMAILGDSFSGGLVLAAAERSEYSQAIKLVISVSGYNSINRLSHYYLSDRVLQPDGQRYVGPPIAIGPFLIAFQYLNALVGASDVLPIRTAMAAWFNQQTQTPQGRRALQDLTPAQNAQFQEFIDGHSPRLKVLLQEQVLNDQQKLNAISPEGKLQHIACPVYILHGANDVVIPRGEALWNTLELGARADVHTLITAGMGHGGLDHHSRRKERIKVGFFLLRALLAIAARRGTIPFFVP